MCVGHNACVTDCMFTLSPIISGWVFHLTKCPVCAWLSFLPAVSVWESFLLAWFFLLLLPSFTSLISIWQPGYLVPLLHIFVFPSVFSATLADRHAFLKLIASLLVYRVWTTFQKRNSKNLLKLFDDKFWKFHRTPEQADDLKLVWNCIFLKLSRLS